MKIKQFRYSDSDGWLPQLNSDQLNPQLILLFGSRELFEHEKNFLDLKKNFSSAHMLGCTTAGEIFDTIVSDETLVATAIEFEHTQIIPVSVIVTSSDDSFEAGRTLSSLLPKENLVHVFVLSDGSIVNGSKLVKGITSGLPSEVSVTGGLAADSTRFERTLVLSDSVRKNMVAAIGLYGDRLRVGYGSLGGWDSFGPERLVTKSDGNILFEIDGRSALDLYKTYLGEHAAELPAAAMLFPLSLRSGDNATPVVRTILNIDEENQSMIFAGDIPNGAYVRLMKANFDRLIDGAAGAASTSYQAIGSDSPELAILISCVGRKLVLGQRIEEEVESVRDILGEKSVLTGFYSYGEISPFTPNARCELHNQTMTITTLSEL